MTVFLWLCAMLSIASECDTICPNLFPCWNGSVCTSTQGESEDCSSSSLRCNQDCELQSCAQTQETVSESDRSITCTCLECVSKDDYILYDGNCQSKDVFFQDVDYEELSHALLIQSEFLYSELERILLTPDCGAECEDKMVELIRASSYAFFEVYQERFDFLFILPYLPMPSYKEDTLGRMFRMEGVAERLLGTAILNMEPSRGGDPYRNLHLIASYWGSRLREPFITNRGKGAWEVSGLNVAGQLGGWQMNDFECVEPLGAKLSSESNDCNTNEIRVPSELGKREYGDDANPIYAKMELMLMGILDEEELASENDILIHCQDASLIGQYKVPETDIPFTTNLSSYEWSRRFPQPSEIDPSYYGDKNIMNHYSCSELLTFSSTNLTALLPDSSIKKLNKSTELALGFMVLFPANTSWTDSPSDDLQRLNLYLQNFSEMFTSATLGYASATTKLLLEIVEPEIQKRDGWVENNITAIVVVVVILFLVCLTLSQCVYTNYSNGKRRRKGYRPPHSNNIRYER